VLIDDIIFETNLMVLYLHCRHIPELQGGTRLDSPCTMKCYSLLTELLRLVQALFILVMRQLKCLVKIVMKTLCHPLWPLLSVWHMNQALLSPIVKVSVKFAFAYD
jgi:hypothetical protein